MGTLPDICIPEGPIQVVVTLIDTILANSGLNSAVQVRVTLTPEVTGLAGLLAIFTMVGLGTVCVEEDTLSPGPLPALT